MVDAWMYIDVGLVPMYGHSRGHSAVIVGTGARWLVHAGDAYFHRNTVEGTGRVPIGFAGFERPLSLETSRVDKSFS